MARYVFSICVNGSCVYHDESTPEQDRIDAAFAEMGGSGYLSFWKKCKEVFLGVRELIDAVNGNPMAKEVFPELASIAGADKEQVEAIITDLDYGHEKRL